MDLNKRYGKRKRWGSRWRAKVCVHVCVRVCVCVTERVSRRKSLEKKAYFPNVRADVATAKALCYCWCLMHPKTHSVDY